MTVHKMAGYASFSLIEPHVTHGTRTDSQIDVRSCTGCGRLFWPKRLGKNSVVVVADSELRLIGRHLGNSWISPLIEPLRHLLGFVDGP